MVKKWYDITRSKTPFDYKAALNRVMLNHERLNQFLANEIEKMERMKMKNPDEKEEVEVVDMDEESKSEETLDDVEVEEESEPEPEEKS